MNLGALTRRLRSEEHGVVLVMVAMLMTVFIAFAALAIDLGSLDGAQRRAQAAADAGALAGAAALTTTTNTVAASSTATTLAKTNYPTGTPTVSTSGNQVTVKVTANPPNFFGRAFPVGATAVASSTSTSSKGPALYANGTSCGGGITINPGNVTMPDGIVSNGSITMAGTGGVYGPSTYASNCSFYANSGSTANTFAGSYSPTPVTTTVNWPNQFSGFPSPASNCTYYVSGTMLFQNDDNSTLSPGTYCADTININGSNLSGNVTFQAANFQFNGTNEHFTPFYQGLLFYGTGSSYNVNCNNGTSDWLLAGGLYAPNGSVTLNTCTGTINSFVEAQSITLAGGGTTDWTSTLTNPTGGTGSVALTQ